MKMADIDYRKRFSVDPQPVSDQGPDVDLGEIDFESTDPMIKAGLVLGLLTNLTLVR